MRERNMIRPSTRAQAIKPLAPIVSNVGGLFPRSATSALGREYAFADVESGHSVAFLANGRCAADRRLNLLSAPPAPLADQLSVRRTVG